MTDTLGDLPVATLLGLWRELTSLILPQGTGAFYDLLSPSLDWVQHRMLWEQLGGQLAHIWLRKCFPESTAIRTNFILFLKRIYLFIG